jgi:hypothetical protein
VENAYADSYPHIASLCAITPQHRLWFGSASTSYCGWADGKKVMVPREGIIRNHRHDEPLFVLSMVA